MSKASMSCSSRPLWECLYRPSSLDTTSL